MEKEKAVEEVCQSDYIETNMVNQENKEKRIKQLSPKKKSQEETRRTQGKNEAKQAFEKLPNY